MRYLLAFCIAVMVAAAPADAQDALAALQPGTRVRITAPGLTGRRVVGEVITTTSDSLLISSRRHAVPLAFSRSSLIRVERSVGPQRWVGRGALLGATTGTLLGIVCLAVCPLPDNSGANLAPVGGLIYGTLFGAIGGAVTRREQWKRLDMRPDATRRLR